MEGVLERLAAHSVAVVIIIIIIIIIIITENLVGFEIVMAVPTKTDVLGMRCTLVCWNCTNVSVETAAPFFRERFKL